MFRWTGEDVSLTSPNGGFSAQQKLGSKDYLSSKNSGLIWYHQLQWWFHQLKTSILPATTQREFTWEQTKVHFRNKKLGILTKEPGEKERLTGDLSTLVMSDWWKNGAGVTHHGPGKRYDSRNLPVSNGVSMWKSKFHASNSWRTSRTLGWWRCDHMGMSQNLGTLVKPKNSW